MELDRISEALARRLMLEELEELEEFEILNNSLLHDDGQGPSNSRPEIVNSVPPRELRGQPQSRAMMNKDGDFHIPRWIEAQDMIWFQEEGDWLSEQIQYYMWLEHINQTQAIGHAAVLDNKGKGKDPINRFHQPNYDQDLLGVKDNPEKHEANEATCASCMENIILRNAFSAPCTHVYCKECFIQHIIISLRGEAGSFPPKCCNLVLEERSVKEALPQAEYQKYKDRVKDHSDQLQLFCPMPRCATRLEMPHVMGETGTCPRCDTKICTKCKQVEHKGVCEKHEVKKLAKKEGWAGCPKCGRIVEKNKGTCNKIMCM
jgi:hypothetical protein